MSEYRQPYQVVWQDLDANNHFKNTAYLECAAQTRFLFFAEQGFTPARFAELQLGPVALKDQVEYFKELRFLDSFSVGFKLSAMAKKGHRFMILNEIYNQSEELCARVSTDCAWFNLTKRKIARPEEALLEVMLRIQRTDEFYWL